MSLPKFASGSGTAGLFGKIKIKAKIMLGFAMLLAILAAVSGTGYFDLVKVGHEVALYTESVEEAAVAGRIETEFLRLAAHAREFANSGHEEDVEFVHEVAKELRLEIEHGLKVVREPEHLEKMEQIAKDFEIYMTDFEKAVVLRHEHDKLVSETLDPDGEKFIADLDEMLKEVVQEGNADAAIYIGVAREHGLLARLYANILIDRGDESYGAKTLEQFHEITLALTALEGTIKTDEERRLFAELNELLEEYEAGFEKVHEDDIELEHLINGEMKEAAAEIVEDGAWL